MLLLFRLPFLVLEAVVRQGARGLAAVAGLVRGGAEEEPWPPAETPMRPAPAEEATVVGAEERFGAAVAEEELEEEEAHPTAEEALRRRREREAVERAAPPVTEPPASAPLGAEAHVDSEPSLVESFGPPDDVAGPLTVDEPWEGYDGMPASAVVARMRGADEATRAVVGLYERTHKKRQTILRAARQT